MAEALAAVELPLLADCLGTVGEWRVEAPHSHDPAEGGLLRLVHCGAGGSRKAARPMSVCVCGGGV